MHTRIVPAAGAAWEAVRYVFLAVLFTIHYNRELSGEHALFFLWITSAFFIMLAALLLAALRPRQYGVLVTLVGVGKGLQFLAGLLLFLYEQRVFAFLRSLFVPLSSSGAAAERSSSLTLISAIVGIDLIFAFILLLYGPKTGSSEGQTGTQLPHTQVTEVEET
jgi:hypothetical protein